MQKKSIGSQIWELFSPLVVKMVVALVVETAIITAYIMPSMEEIVASAATQEELYQMTMEMALETLPYSTQISAVAALVTIPFLIRMMRKDRKKEQVVGIVPNKKASLGKYAWIAGISIPVMVALNNILLLVNLAQYSEAYQETAEVLYAPTFPVQLLCVGIVIPIMEEVLFRGLVYKRMRMRVSASRAMVSSALFFGLYHGNSVQMIYGALCGLLLAYLYEKYGSLKAPILAHVLMNVVACIITEVDGFTWMFQQPIRVGIITVVCAAIASSMFVLIREIDEKPERTDEIFTEEMENES